MSTPPPRPGGASGEGPFFRGASRSRGSHYARGPSWPTAWAPREGDGYARAPWSAGAARSTLMSRAPPLGRPRGGREGRALTAARGRRGATRTASPDESLSSCGGCARPRPRLGSHGWGWSRALCPVPPPAGREPSGPNSLAWWLAPCGPLAAAPSGGARDKASPSRGGHAGPAVPRTSVILVVRPQQTARLVPAVSFGMRPQPAGCGPAGRPLCALTAAAVARAPGSP